MSQVAHQAGAYPDFCSMKRLGVFLLPPGWDAIPSQGYITMSPAGARTRTAQSEDERTNHEATTPTRDFLEFQLS